MQGWTTLHRWVAAPFTLAFAGAAQAQQPLGLDGSSELATPGMHAAGGSASLTLGLYTGRSITGRREVGGQIVLEIPFGRLVTPGAAAPLAEPPTPTPQPRERPRPRPRIAVKPSLARACVRAAWRAHALADLDMLDRMQARARTSALLPEAKFRIAREWDQSYRLTPTTDDPYRLQESNGGGRTLEGRLTWKLDRLLFVDEELSMERLRVQRMQVRSRLAGDVLRALFDWQRARMAAADVALDDTEHVDAIVREAEAEALLDVLTGGWFSAWLEKGST